MKVTKLQQGTIKRHPDGFGFFIPDSPDQPDVYIPRESMNGIMTQDRVKVEVYKERHGHRYRGLIVEVVDHGTKRVVGQFHPLPGGGGILKDVSKGWGAELVILNSASRGAKEGDLVAAEIISYPGEGKFTGRITEVLGELGDPMTDVKRVLLTQHIPHNWRFSVEKEVRTFRESVSEQDMIGRTNLMNLNFVTIDGATAKDFDDAIYVEKRNFGSGGGGAATGVTSAAGFYKLYVAIADVSHYVRLGSAIDQEAYERGTSVYLPNFVEPMLPEVLSNGLCSLNPKVPRLALVAEIDVDPAGHTLKAKFYEAVIESKARVTYGEAQEIIEGQPLSHLKHVSKEIMTAGELARILMARRFAHGSLDLEIPEITVIVDETGTPTDILKSERLFAHRMIEEMMLAANVAVAKFLHEKGRPALYRIHESPPPEALALLERFLNSFGSRAKLSGGKLQKRITRALEEFAGKPQAQVLNILTLRSMSQAKYSSKNVGHFGLGFEHYTHFTSPIRRYPDLIVHRLLKAQIGMAHKYQAMNEEDLATAGMMLSACEQRAVRAERQIQAIKKARFFEKFLGQEFDGLISSVTRFGVFVLLRKYEADGLITLEELSRGRPGSMIFDEQRLRWVARHSGKSYEIGDSVRIRIANVNVEQGQIDFHLVSAKGEKVAAITTTTKPAPSPGAKTWGRRRKKEEFDVEEKLREVLRKRGLQPTDALRHPDSVKKVSAGRAPQPKHKRNKTRGGSAAHDYGKNHGKQGKGKHR
ncbi:MAG: ribonuclease R [Bdellovibrio sp.]|nr:MAG: ribonuclease R [Bdellovibrio sp.]